MAASAAGFALLAVMVAAAGIIVSRNQSFADWAVHTRDVQNRLQASTSLFERAESARRGYLLRADPEYLRVHDQAVAGLGLALDEVAVLTGDNPRQREALPRLRTLLGERAAARDRTLALTRDGRTAEALAAFNSERDQRTLEQTRATLSGMIAEEDRLLDYRSEQRADSGRAATWTILGLAPVLLLVAAGTIRLLWNYTSDLNDSREALRRLNAGLEEAVAARTSELRTANEEIQRFAYIVSHDLRSPLVNVMGFTSELEAGLPALNALVDGAEARAPKLLTVEAREVVRSEIPEAIGFIRASTAKMDRLINAILRLSREGRRTLTPEALNMQVLLDSVVANQKQRIDQAGARVTVRWPMPDIVNDRLAVEQVFGNLLDNALKYLQPGRSGEISVSGRTEGARVIFEVRDNGRGIDPTDHQRVFDLFRRAGVQDQAGEGIGLAHVRALVHRLGGTIGVESELEQGATFRISLPPVLEFEGPARS